MAEHRLWDSLVSAALVGTERRGFTLPAAEGPLGRALGRLPAADPEATLLAAAALVAAHRRAARLPPTAALPAVEPCEPDAAPGLNARAGQHLKLMLEGQYSDLLPECLAEIAMHGKCAPPELLPALLQAGIAKENLRDDIARIVGKRGRWLARLGPWAYAAGSHDADETVWQTGGKGERLAWFKRLRQRNPPRARELAEASWSQEASDLRAALTELFAVGLSMDDEPFLESLLDDRRKDVRRAAAGLLAALPESRLCQRMAQRVAPLVKWRGGRRPGFDVTLPQTVDQGMQRDGLDEKPTQGAQVLGEKSGWLAGMLASTPLGTWESLSHSAPPAILEAASRNRDWSAVLLDGFGRAAARQSNLAWAEALLEHNRYSASTWLFAALPVDRQEKYVLKLLSLKTSLRHGELATAFVLACRHRWSQTLSAAVLEAAARDLAEGEMKYSYQYATLLELLAVHTHPALLAEAARRLPEAAGKSSALARPLDELQTTLQFRDDMLNAIRS